MTDCIRIEKLASGFWCVWIRNEWINAALASEQDAKQFVETWLESHKTDKKKGA